MDPPGRHRLAPVADAEAGLAAGGQRPPDRGADVTGDAHDDVHGGSPFGRSCGV
jgi:hypothetical protein